MNKYLSSKIHGATVTETALPYSPALVLGHDMMQAAQIEPFQAVEVENLATGAAFTTHAVPGQPGTVGLHGPSARRAAPGDRLVICAYTYGAAFTGAPLVFVQADNSFALDHYLPVALSAQSPDQGADAGEAPADADGDGDGACEDEGACEDGGQDAPTPGFADGPVPDAPVTLPRRPDAPSDGGAALPVPQPEPLPLAAAALAALPDPQDGGAECTCHGAAPAPPVPAQRCNGAEPYRVTVPADAAVNATAAP